jgi:hypothetical protein
MRPPFLAWQILLRPAALQPKPPGVSPSDLFSENSLPCQDQAWPKSHRRTSHIRHSAWCERSPARGRFRGRSCDDRCRHELHHGPGHRDGCRSRGPGQRPLRHGCASPRRAGSSHGRCSRASNDKRRVRIAAREQGLITKKPGRPDFCRSYCHDGRPFAGQLVNCRGEGWSGVLFGIAKPKQRDGPYGRDNDVCMP